MAVALTRPMLILVTNRKLCGADALVAAVADAVEAGVNAVQLREKDLPPDELLALARRLREVTQGRSLLLVNGLADIALASEADGVHLPEEAPMIERRRAGFLIGRSVHSVDAARRAEQEAVDYLVAGPVYETSSHPGAPAVGAGLIAAIASAVTIPVIAIGGITAARLPEVVSSGASGVAVISAILGAPDRREAARALWAALKVTAVRRDVISITLNGKLRGLQAETTVTSLLESFTIDPRQVAVALNGEVIRRDAWPSTTINDGDAVEIVRAVGGGSWL